MGQQVSTGRVGRKGMFGAALQRHDVISEAHEKEYVSAEYVSAINRIPKPRVCSVAVVCDNPISMASN